MFHYLALEFIRIRSYESQWLILDIRNTADEREAKKKLASQRKPQSSLESNPNEEEEVSNKDSCTDRPDQREMSLLLNLKMVKYIDDLFNADKITNAKGNDLMNEKMYFDELEKFSHAFRKLAAAYAVDANEKPKKVVY